MAKIAIASGETPFLLSAAAVQFVRRRKAGRGIDWHHRGHTKLALDYLRAFSRQIDRDDPALISAIEELGPDAGYERKSIVIVEVPNGTTWEIIEVAGFECLIKNTRWFNYRSHGL